jgi:hypothetical protein
VSHWNHFQSLLDQLAHEDALLLARTQWLVISQPLLWLAYACIDKTRLAASPPRDLHRAISVLGLVSTIFILAAILASIKVFIELRTDLYALMVQHPDLPMRRLPRVGIGAGLLCPILLSLAFLCAWSLLTFPSTWPAVLLTISGAFISLNVIGGAHEFSDETSRISFLSSTFVGGVVLLITAILLGVRSLRSPTGPRQRPTAA